jgi:hypothetical protein
MNHSYHLAVKSTTTNFGPAPAKQDWKCESSLIFVIGISEAIYWCTWLMLNYESVSLLLCLSQVISYLVDYSCYRLCLPWCWCCYYCSCWGQKGRPRARAYVAQIKASIIYEIASRCTRPRVGKKERKKACIHLYTLTHTHKWHATTVNECRKWMPQS